MSERKPVQVYLAGPMRGIPAFNFPAFFEAEERILDWCSGGSGTLVFNPARNDCNEYGLDPATPYESGEKLLHGDYDFSLRKAIGQDLAWICDYADAMIVLPGWEKSSGVRSERACCEALGIPVYTLAEWFGEDFGEDLEVPATTVAEEVRVTSATGGQKGTKLAAFDQVSPEVEMLVAEHFGKGARKYSAHNFRKGYPWSMSYSALRRHLAAFWAGEEYDVCGPACPRPEPRGESEHGPICFNHTGSLHIVCAVWHSMVLTEFFLHQPVYDDRFIYGRDDDSEGHKQG